VISEGFQCPSYSLDLVWGESGIVLAGIVSDDACKDGGIDLWAKFSLMVKINSGLRRRHKW
jgi:hypothetical protein